MPESGPIVSNSGPLVALSAVFAFDLLRQLHGSILIPPAVYEEVVVAGSGRPGAREVSSSPWIQTAKSRPKPDPMLVEELGSGEAEAIALAVEVRAQRLLLDDRRARRIAEIAYRLSVQGVAGVLVAARKRGLVETIRPLLVGMRAAGYHLSDRLILAACREVGEVGWTGPEPA
jgi:hypothetical protein